MHLIRIHTFRPLLAVALLWVAAAAFSDEPSTAATSPSLLTTLRLKSENGKQPERSGRVLAEAPDGTVLLEEASGTLLTIAGSQIVDRAEHSEAFRPFSRDQMAEHLLELCGPTFEVYQTDNFAICSDASPRFTRYVGRLLQKVVEEYREFFAESELKLSPLPKQLPVIIFRSSATFQEFAQRQHPDADFSDVPGYYSVQHNQMLVAAPAGDREFRSDGEMLNALQKNLRQVETIVHESVHQLTFNSGLLVRYANNPLWLSEGLAVYFEYASGRGRLLWTGPGGVNRIHLPGFKRAGKGDSLRLPLSQLCSRDDSFNSDTQQFADSYAVGWALTYYLVRIERKQFDQYLSTLSRRRPYEEYPGDERLKQLNDAIMIDLDELERRLLRYVERLRVR